MTDDIMKAYDKAVALVEGDFASYHEHMTIFVLAACILFGDKGKDVVRKKIIEAVDSVMINMPDDMPIILQTVAILSRMVRKS